MWSTIRFDGSEDDTVSVCRSDNAVLSKNLYELQTAATISANKEVTENPRVLTCLRGPYIAVVLDQSVAVFTNEGCKLWMCLELESKVECISITEDEQLLLIADENGTLQTFYLIQKKQISKTKLFSPDSNGHSFKAIESVLQVNKTGNTTVYNLSTSGQLIIYNIKSEDLRKGAEKDDWQELAKIVFDSQQTMKVADSEELFSLPLSLFALQSTIETEKNLENCDFNLHNGMECCSDEQLLQTFPLIDSSTIKKMLKSNDGVYVFVLDNQNTFHVFSAVDLVHVKSWSEEVCDFHLMETTDNEGNIQAQEIVFLLADNHESIAQLQIRCFPTFELMLTVKLDSPVWIIGSICNQESFFILQGKYTKEKNLLHSFKLQLVSQTSPDTRLASLLRKGKFSEAEALAKLFQLDFERVYKLQVTQLIDDLNSCSKLVVIQEVKLILQKIKDFTFVMECCINAVFPSSEDTKEILAFAREVYEKSSFESGSEWILKVTKLSHKLDAFLMMFPDENDWVKWNEFKSKGFLEAFLDLLQASQIENAIILWEKLKAGEVESALKTQDIEQILQSIPDILSSKELSSFLKNYFLPEVIVFRPQLIDEIADWMNNYAQLLEITEKVQWPNNAVTFLKILPEVCEKICISCQTKAFPAAVELGIHVQQERSLCPNSQFNSLLSMIEDLEQVQFLKDNYNCKITLSDFRMEDKSCVVYSLLDRLVGSKKLGEAVNQFLRRYIKQHNLDMNTVFCRYIQETLQSYEVDWWGSWQHEDAVWETTVLEVLQHIFDPDDKMQVILDIVSACPLPWSKAIVQLVDNQLLTENCRNNELMEQVRQSRYKAVLLKYIPNMRNLDIYDGHFVSILLIIIFKQHKETALEDALQVAKAFCHISDSDVHLQYMLSLLAQLKVDSFLDHFVSLDGELLPILAGRILSYTMEQLNFEFVIRNRQKRSEISTLITSSISVVNNFIRIHPSKLHDVEDDLACLMICSALMREYGIFITPKDVVNTETRWDFFNKLILLKHQKIQEEDCRGVHFEQSPSKFTSYQLIRISDILGLPATEANGKLAIALAEMGMDSSALQICRELCDLNESDSHCFHSLILHILKNISKFKENRATLLQSVYCMAAHMVSTCSPENVTEYVTMCQWSHFLLSMTRLDSHCSTSEDFADCYHRWRFSAFYQEQGLRIDINLLLPLFVKCWTLGTISQTPPESLPNSKGVLDVCRQVLLHLRSRGQEFSCIKFLLLLNIILGNELLQLGTEGPNFVVASRKQIFKDISKSAVTRIVSQRKVDLSLALGLVTMNELEVTKASLMELIQMFGGDFIRLKYLAKLGATYFSMLKHPVMIEKCKKIYTSANWITQLSKMHVNVKDPARFGNPTEANKIVQDMFPVADLQIILEFCNNFGLDTMQTKLSYLKFLVSQPLVKKWGFTDSQPNDVQVKKLNEELAKADQCITKLADCSELKETLCTLLNKVNSYCYEVIEWLLNHISKLESQKEAIATETTFDMMKYIEVLRFLSMYKRIDLPTEFEIDLWLNDNPQHDHLPSISSVRLPCQVLINSKCKSKWKIISQEVYAKNVQFWIDIAPLLQVDSDQLLVTAAQNEVQAWLAKIQQKKKESQEQSTEQQCEDVQLSNTLKGLIQRIGDISMATACTAWIVKSIPPGPTKVAAASASLKLSELWLSRSPSNQSAIDSHQKMLDVYHRMAVKHELDLSSLSNPDTLALAQDPLKLIIHILESYCPVDLFHMQHRKLFSTVKEIAKIGGLDLMEIYRSLLEKWCPQRDALNADDDMSMTVCMDNPKFVSQLSADEEDSTRNLCRTIYLLHEISNENLFMEHATTVFQNWDSSGHKEREHGLRSLFAVADFDQIHHLSGSEDPQALWDELQFSMYIARLEELHMPYTLSMFANCNKADLVESLLVSHTHNPKALLLCSSICTQYKIWNQVYWDIILHNMTDLNLIQPLHCILWQIAHVPSLWHSSSVIRAWECFLKGLIHAASSSGNVLEAMVDAYTSLIMCPCFAELSVSALAEEFEYFGYPFLAMCTHVMNFNATESRQTIIKKFHQKHSQQKIEEEITQIRNSVPTFKFNIFKKVVDLCHLQG